MADTDFDAGYPNSAYFDPADILLLMRGAGGVNVLASALVGKRSDGKFLAQGTSDNAPTLGARKGIIQFAGVDPGYGLQIGVDSASGAPWLQGQRVDGGTAAYNILLNPAGGNVGIGTPGPIGKLDLSGTSRVRWDLSGSIAQEITTNPAANAYAVKQSDADSHRFLCSSTERLRVEATALTVKSPTVWVNTDKMLIQHDGSNGYFRSQNAGGSLYLGVNGNSVWQLSTSGPFLPTVDNVYSIGTGSNRLSVVFAGTGTINTSDERDKLWRGFSDELQAKVRRISRAIMEQLGFFQFLDQIEEKGEDGARWHFGVKAQYVWSLFADEGLCAPLVGTGADQRPDPAWHGPPPPAFLCWDIWEDRYEPVYEEQQVDTETVVIWQEPTGVLDQHGQPLMRDVTEERPVMGMVEVGQELKQAAGNRFGLRVDQLGLLLDWALHDRLAALEAA